ncbi:MAG: ABC-type transport auxiliary lipoprotein family protein [Desulfovibrio sp.]|nr:ABC-type transport auxiliary lipoprotein family protein [Desulfovibrio sp.]
MKREFVIAVALLALCGCARSDPTNYYLLESGAEPVTTDKMPKTTLRIAQVEIPSYLNRNNIVSRVKGETMLIVAEFHLWAEPVGAGTRRVVEETLLKPMLEAGINVLPAGTASGGDYTLLLDIARLDGNFNEKAVLDCRWTLLNREERPIESGVYRAEEMVNGADYNALVATESELIRDMGRHLADALPGLINKNRQ